jgi:hypothetical protein
MRRTLTRCAPQLPGRRVFVVSGNLRDVLAEVRGEEGEWELEEVVLEDMV